jgi:hypothetical protein
MTALLHATALAACCLGIHLQPAKHAPRFDPPPLAIGDSVLLGAAHEVARKGFEVDAREGRFMRNALKVLRHLKRDDRHPPVVIVAIGTNMPATAQEIRQALALLRRDQTLAFVTPKRSWSGLPSGALFAAHRRHPHRVRVLDWLSFSASRDDWFYADGTHLRPSGARAYARLLAHALRWIGPDSCACEGRIYPSPMITSTAT